MTLSTNLQEIGLTKSEATIYLYLLKSGSSTPPQIANGTKIARPNCYEVLRRLEAQNLLTAHKKGERSIYTAKDPSSLLEQQQQMLKRVGDLLPELQSIHKTKKDKPNIQFLEGFNQVKQIWDRSLEATHIRGITSTEALFKNSPAFFKAYHTKLKKKGTLLQDIITKDSLDAAEWNRENMGPMYEIKVLPKNYETLPTDILIWNNTVALMNIVHPISATVLTDQHMADTFRILFDLSWKQLSKK